GPAFEGGGITFGMRAMKGAIERIDIDPTTYEVTVQTIGRSKAIGICGSGLIDCIAKLRDAGIIDRTGKFQPVPSERYRMNDESPEFVLVWAKDSGIDKDIVITEADVKNLIRSKGAVYAGIRSLLKMVSMDLEVIDKILIAGGFGNYLNLADAVKIGLLPDVPLEKYEFVGNTSVKGAHLCLLSQKAFEDALEIGRKMTYIELSAGTTFMDEFVSALFLPHTDLSLFPSVTA
ncbi:MAG TPA: ATP-binding protein, partial [Clostridia bacterium]|nr:ATP-binding protein [Clostridia bacterium]